MLLPKLWLPRAVLSAWKWGQCQQPQQLHPEPFSGSVLYTPHTSQRDKQIDGQQQCKQSPQPCSPSRAGFWEGGQVHRRQFNLLAARSCAERQNKMKPLLFCKV